MVKYVIKRIYTMSLQTIYASQTIGITDLKRDSGIIDHITAPIAILKRDSIKGYLISTELMAKIADYLEDIELAEIVNLRLKELDEGKTKSIKVNIDDL